jgi:hypothetical protein
MLSLHRNNFINHGNVKNSTKKFLENSCPVALANRVAIYLMDIGSTEQKTIKTNK